MITQSAGHWRDILWSSPFHLLPEQARRESVDPQTDCIHYSELTGWCILIFSLILDEAWLYVWMRHECGSSDVHPCVVKRIFDNNNLMTFFLYSHNKYFEVFSFPSAPPNKHAVNQLAHKRSCFCFLILCLFCRPPVSLPADTVMNWFVPLITIVDKLFAYLLRVSSNQVACLNWLVPNIFLTKVFASLWSVWWGGGVG